MTFNCQSLLDAIPDGLGKLLGNFTISEPGYGAATYGFTGLDSLLRPRHMNGTLPPFRRITWRKDWFEDDKAGIVKVLTLIARVQQSRHIAQDKGVLFSPILLYNIEKRGLTPQQVLVGIEANNRHKLTNPTAESGTYYGVNMDDLWPLQLSDGMNGPMLHIHGIEELSANPPIKWDLNKVVLENMVMPATFRQELESRAVPGALVSDVVDHPALTGMRIAAMQNVENLGSQGRTITIHVDNDSLLESFRRVPWPQQPL